MVNMSLKSVLFFSLSILALSTNASALESKEALAKECRELANTVASLVSSQEKKACVEKLGMASVYIDNAGDLILDDMFNFAKKELDNAIYNLQYAELNSCNRYIQISHSKFAAQSLKNSL